MTAMHNNLRTAVSEPLQDAGPPAAVIDLRGVLDVFRRRAKLIAGCALALPALGLAAMALLPARYEARTDLLLDPQGLQVLQNELTPRSAGIDASLAQAESQLRVILSTSVLEKVVERERLADDPEFGAPSPGLLPDWLTWLKGLGSPAAREGDRARKALRVLRNHIGAYRPDKTYVVELVVWTTDPAKSARLANAIAEAYVDSEAAAKADVSRRTSASLAARLNELRERVQSSEEAIEAYKSKNNLVGASGRLIGEQQLTEMNNQLVQARSRAAELAARYEDIRRVQQTRLDPAALPEMLQSPVIAGLRAQYTEIKRIEAERLTQLGPRHPLYASVMSQERQVVRLIRDEISRIASAALSDLNRARANQRSLEQSIESLKREAINTSEASVRLRELEREADSNRAVYEAFLKRVKEISEQESVNTNNTRIITPAVPPAERSGPRRPLVLGGLLGLGLAVGAGLALVLEQVNPLIRAPGQVQDETGLRLLAQMPGLSSRKTRSWWPTSRRPPALSDGRIMQERAALRKLHKILRSAHRRTDGRVVLVVSSRSTTPRSELALGLAIAAADRGEHALLIDADFRQGQLTSSFAPAAGAGLSDVIAGRRSLAEAISGTNWRGVNLLPTGKARKAGLGRSRWDRIRESILNPAKIFDVLIIDAGRLPASPAQPLFELADHILVVVELDVDSGSRIASDLHVLEGAREKVLGAVVVGAHRS